MSFEKILNLYKNTICIAKTGSSLFVQNNNDLDYIVITDDEEKIFKRERIDGVDYFIKSKSVVRDMIDCLIAQSAYILTLDFAKQNVEYGEFPYRDYSIYNMKGKVIDLIINRFIKNYFSPTKILNTKNELCCCKIDYWLFATYFALVNNTLDFTEEQLEIIQKCHDNDLPRSYAKAVLLKLVEIRDSDMEE